jgi:hypothetical protein
MFIRVVCKQGYKSLGDVNLPFSALTAVNENKHLPVESAASYEIICR